MVDVSRPALPFRRSDGFAPAFAEHPEPAPLATFPQAPRFIPDGRISRVRLATLAVPRGPSRRRRSSSADSHPPLATSVYPLARHLGQWRAQCPARAFWCPPEPRAPLPTPGVTSCGGASRAPSEGITPPSSLLRAHRPDPIPPGVFGLPSTAGLCRLSSVPAGRGPFPALSPQSL